MPADETSNPLLDRLQKLSPKRLALLASELERRLAAREEVAPEPIAVIGLACRMPGGSDTADEFWTILEGAQDAIEVVPAARWDAEAFYDSCPDTPGKMVTKWGGFVRQVDQFDPAFFGISPREALGIDPQQRMLLEVAWEALENAGERTELLVESATGVYIGVSTSDYASQVGVSDGGASDAYSATGVAHSTAAGRLSYFFGLKGPNLALDTSCSSSAVAIHLACQGLRNGECRRALAGGVNAMIVPQVTIMLSQAHMLASDGRCKTFSRSADGFVRSEGCGILVLKRLSDAHADGDRILGVIRGSAINHDGRSSGLAAPNGPSQEAVVRAALAQARVTPREIDYVETHGTGTVLGDAIELGALTNVFGGDRVAESRLVLGAVKTNVGHLEAAAGVTGVIKVLLALNHESIPANLHLEAGNENEALEEHLFQVPLVATKWPRTKRPRIAGVSSFGFSGTNAHLVVQEAPLAEPLEAALPMEVEVITVSAKTQAALSALCEKYAQFLRGHPKTSLRDFAYTANACRSQFQHRVALLVRSIEDAAAQLEQLSGSGLERSTAYRFIAGYEPPPIAFLFTGQGSQYMGMGRAFYKGNSVFRAAIDRCDQAIAGKLAYRLSAVLAGAPDVPPELIDDTAWTQPALFAFEYALARTWQSWGVQPSVLIGHSLGEYVAACVAGVFSLDEALTLAYERGRLMGGLPRTGNMLAVRASEAAVLQAVGQLSAMVSIAAINGPESIVLSGRSEEIDVLNRQLTEKGIKAQPLTVSHAFHSPMMDPMLDEFERRASELKYSASEIPFVSNVTGRLFAPGEQIDARYWRRHVRGTVRFSDGLNALLKLQPAALLEVGPHPVLLGMAKFAYPDLALPSLPALRRARDEWQCAFEALQQLYLLGAQIDWDAVYRDRAKQKLSLPTYPFQRQRYWLAAKPTRANVTPPDAKPIPAKEQFEPCLYEVQWSWADSESKYVSQVTPRQAIQAAEKEIAALTADRIFGPSLAAVPAFKPQMDSLCASFVLEAFEKMGIDIQPGARLDQYDLPTALGARPEFARLLDRLFAILEEDGLVRRSGSDWEFAAARSFDTTTEKKRLLTEYPQFSAELNFLAQCSHLADVLRGRMHPLEALFPQGSLALSERVYQESPIAGMFNRAVSAAIRCIVQASGSGQRVKILEVGAGTGSTTSQVLPQLPADRVDYIFTDVSPAFLLAARKKFADYPSVQYMTLDLEDEGLGRNIGPQSVDLILAANVLHATADIKRSIERLARLLRPHGMLVLLEGTMPSRFGDLTVGMTEGWGLYNDAPLREKHPLIARQQWLDLFGDLGFSAKAIQENGVAFGLTSQQTIIVAQWDGAVVSENSCSALSTLSTLVIGEGIRLSRVQKAFASAGVSVQTATGFEESLLGVETSEDLRRVRKRIGAGLRAAGQAETVLLLLPDTSQVKDPPAAARDNAMTVLALLQEVVDARSGDIGYRRPSVWLVTHGAYAFEADDGLDLPGSVAEAIAKTARLEYPDLSIRSVDLPGQPAEEDLARLVALVRQGTKEHTVALRRGGIAMPRLVPLNSIAGHRRSAFEIREKASYLVTGAFSGIGLRTAQWLAERGAEELYLVGRSEPSQQARQQMRKSELAGARIHIRIVDVSKRRDMQQLFHEINGTPAALRGIVHSAGTFDDAALARQTPEQFVNVFAPKVQGGWLLHEFSLQHPLDFFVMFGSAASLLGLAGASNYVAANAFLGALAELRHQQGLPATTIAWGHWQETGMSARVKAAERLSASGLNAISPEAGVDLVQQAVESGVPELAALSVDWTMFLAPQRPHHGWQLFDKLLVRQPEVLNSTAGVTLTSMVENASPEHRLEVIKEYARARIASVLMLEADFTLREDQPLAELGLDSLMAVTLKNQIQSATGAVLPSTFLFQYPTLRLVASYLDGVMDGTREGKSAGTHSSGYEEIVL